MVRSIPLNLENAPRNTRGRVEYSTSVEIYRPINMNYWNRAIYHTVPNRGRPGHLAPTDTRIVPYLPIARQPDGSSIVGTAMEESVFNDADSVSTVSLTYDTASINPELATMTVRRSQTGPRMTPNDLIWSYANSGEIRIERPSEFDGGAIYEFIYEAKDPIVMGLGLTAMRDAISFLRYETADAMGNENPIAPSMVRRATRSPLGSRKVDDT